MAKSFRAMDMAIGVLFGFSMKFICRAGRFSWLQSGSDSFAARFVVMRECSRPPGSLAWEQLFLLTLFIRHGERARPILSLSFLLAFVGFLLFMRGRFLLRTLNPAG